MINILVYLDKVEDGGTAVYESAWIPNREGEGLLQPVEETMDLSYVIPINSIDVSCLQETKCMVHI